MKRCFIIIVLVCFLTACNREKVIKPNDNQKLDNPANHETQIKVQQDIVNVKGTTIATRFNVPDGYTRLLISEDSFAQYLRNVPLKTHDSQVLYYNGKVKKNKNVYEAVVDMEIGKKNLQQCADAVMRLRGEYLYGQGRYDDIHFNLTNGFRVDYNKWIQGYRVKVEGNKTSWVKKGDEVNTYENFRNYMTFVFIYAGTLSLEKELNQVKFDDMEIGDVLIQGGSPGHAVIVVDMAVNKQTGKKLYMLAQSYMPAQDIQILANPNNKIISPWYTFDDNELISTPEWLFSKEDLKRFNH